MPGPTDRFGYSPGSPFYNNPAAGSLGGAPPFGYSGAYGGIPQVPDPSSSAAAAIQGALGNMGQFSNLANQVNPFNTGQLNTQLEQLMPGYGGAQTQNLMNIGQGLQGQLQNDVTNQIFNVGAGRGLIAGGGGAGGNTNAAILSAIGRTSYQQMQDATRNLAQTVQTTPRTPLLTPQSYFISPQEQQEAQTYANIYGAAPVPSEAARAAEDAARRGLNTGAGMVPRAPGAGYANQSNFGGYGGSNFGGNLNTATDVYRTPGSSFDWSKPGQFSPPGGAGGTGGDWLNQLISGPMGDAYSQLFQSEQFGGGGGGGMGNNFDWSQFFSSDIGNVGVSPDTSNTVMSGDWSYADMLP